MGNATVSAPSPNKRPRKEKVCTLSLYPGSFDADASTKQPATDQENDPHSPEKQKKKKPAKKPKDPPKVRWPPHIVSFVLIVMTTRKYTTFLKEKGRSRSMVSRQTSLPVAQSSFPGMQSTKL